MATTHPTSLAGFQSLQEAAEAICNLRYDSLEELLRHIQNKLYWDSESDYQRGREKLSNALEDASELVAPVILAIAAAWQISKPFMLPPPPPPTS